MQSRPAGPPTNTAPEHSGAYHVPATCISRPKWMLESLNLLSLQPACLPIFSRQLHQPADAVSRLQGLLLQLQADLVEVSEELKGRHAADVVVAATGWTAAAGARLPTPVLVSKAVLQLVVLASSMQELLLQQFDLLQLLCQQHPQLFRPRSSGDVPSGVRRKVQMSVSVEFQKPESSGDLDALHLLLTVQQQQQQGYQSPVLVDAVPLLLMPAAAQQEVQQLLLPAMRQDAQAALTAQQQQQEGVGVSSQEGSLSLVQLHLSTEQVMQLESTVWQHYCQLAQDIFLVWQQSTAAALSMSASGAESSPTAAAGRLSSPSVVCGTGLHSAGGSRPHPTSSALLGKENQQQGGSPPAAATVELLGGPATIELLAPTLLFPVLLPFLAGLGLYNTLSMVVHCLPCHLQQQWRQQQRGHLQAVMAAAPPHQDPAGHLQQLEHHRASSQHLSGISSQSTRQLGAVVAAAAAANANVLEGPSDEAWGALPGQKAAPAATSVAQAVTAVASAPAAPPAAAVGVEVCWYLPLFGFPPADEARYLDWKQHTLLHLDYFAGVFCMSYLAVLIYKTLKQPSTVYYLLYILIKTLPHVPLMMGFRSTYLRFRELWLFLVAPSCLVMLLVCFAGNPSVHTGDVAARVFSKALQAYWRSRGELSTSVLRPFLQHMRLKPYLWYVVLDAAMSVWVFGQVYGYAAAASRWGVAAGLSAALCWGLELYMRRLFVNRQRVLQHTQPATAAAAADSAGSAVVTPVKVKVKSA